MIKYETTVHRGNGCIVRIHKPILTAGERKAREENVKKALVEFYKETRGSK